MSPATVDERVMLLQDVAAPAAAAFLTPGSYLQVDSDPTYDVGAELTVELWLQLPPFVGLPVLVERADPDADMSRGWRFVLGENGPEFQFAVSAAGGPGGAQAHAVRSLDPPDRWPSIADGAWHHCAVVYRQHAGVALIVDGEQRQTVFPLELRYAGRLVNADRPIAVATRRASDETATVAELRIWNIALDRDDIAVDRWRRLTGDEDGLVGYWRFDEIQDGRVPNLVAGRPPGVVEWDPSVPKDAGSDPRLIPIPPEDSGLRLAGPDALPPDDQLELERWRQRVGQARAGFEDSLSALHRLRANYEDVQRQIQRLETEIGEHAKRVEAEARANRAREAEARAEHIRLLNDLRAGAGTKIAALVATLNRQIQEARATLQAQGAPYRLTRVTVELHATPEGVGAGLILPTQEELGSAEAATLSTLRAEFASIEAAGTPLAAKVRAPDLRGYTRALAERKLAETGLKMAVRHEAIALGAQPAEDALRRVNRVVSQDPAPGEDVEAAGTVTVALGDPAASGSTSL